MSRPNEAVPPAGIAGVELFQGHSEQDLERLEREMALFTDRRRSATVKAVEPTECLALHKLEFRDELRRNPKVAIRLLDTLAARLSEEYDQL